MSFSFKRRIYESLPPFVKAPVRWLPFSFWAGPAYRRTLARGPIIDRMSREQVLEYQRHELGRVLRFVVDQVPAYRSLRSAVERQSDPFEALRHFPPITKDELQADFDQYLPRDFDRIAHYESTTGGTSGNQLHLYHENDSHAIETAFMHRQWQRVGYTTRRRKATFRGVEFRHTAAGRYWQHNPIYNELQFSPFHMNEQTLGRYVDQLIRFRPHYLHGYPSALAILADYVLRHEIDLSRLNLRAALLASEAAYPDQRQQIEQAFHCRPFSWYGHSERVILAGECEQTTAYHHLPDYGVLEIIDEAGQPVAEGETGELVGTALFNRAMPLIRYRTDDMARRLPVPCACGRQWDRFDQVVGRWKQEYLIGSRGSRISPTALNMHGPMFDRVVRYQYYQDTPGAMVLRVVAAPGFGPADEKALLDAYKSKTHDELSIRIELVDDIPLTSRGKLRRLIQEIPAESH